MRPYDCSDIDAYTASAAFFKRHILITIGVLRKSCGWAANDDARRMDAEDLVCEALLKLRDACKRTCVDDLYRYVSTTLRNDVLLFCQRAKRHVPFDTHVESVLHGGTTAPGMDQLEAIIACARARIPDERDRELFDLYVDGKPNRAMREVDPRSDRQITRLRTWFGELLKDCRDQFNA